MKTFFKHLMLTATLICCSMLFAVAQGNFYIEGDVIIAGSGGVGKPNWPVTIKSLANTPTFNQTVYTNASGHYAVSIANGTVIGPNLCWEVSTRDTCVTAGTIVYLRDTVCNMQGTVNHTVVNFEIGRNCSPPATCGVGFQYTLNQMNQIAFQSYPVHSNGAQPTTYHWAFGDGTTSSDPNPAHYYPTGHYRACLTVAFPGGCTATFCDSVHVSYGQGSCEAMFNFTLGSSTTAPFQVQFTDASTAGTGHQVISYYWNFGDGNSSTAANPLHGYQTAGTYTVCLIITSSDGCTDDYCHTITVGANTACVAGFTYNNNGLNNLTISFNNTSTYTGASASFQWSFGDGSGSIDVNPTHTYTAAGTYQVCLTITTPNNCSNTYCQSVVVNPPSINCEAAFTFVIQGDTVYFTNNSIPVTQAGVTYVNYHWTFGDGTSSNLKNPKKTWPNYQTYPVCLKITVYNANQTIVCVDSVCHSVMYYPLSNQCDADFNAYVTSSGLVEFNNLSTYAPGTNVQWLWTFGNGTTSNQKNPRVTYSNAGTYTVCLKMKVFNTNNTTVVCEDSICKTIVIPGVTPHCEAAFTAHPAANLRVEFTNNSVSANPSATTYKWVYGDGTDTIGFAPDHIYRAAGTYTVCLYMYDQAANCRDTICKTVVVGQNTPTCTAYFTYNIATLASPFVVYFTDASVSSTPNDPVVAWHWDFGDNTTSNTQNNVHTYASPGQYVVCLTITTVSGCTNTICKPVMLGNNTLCAANFTFAVSGHIATFTNTSNQGGATATYLWMFGDNTSSHDQNPVHTYAAAGQYRVCLKITTANGCVSDVCKWVTVGGISPSNCHAAFTAHVTSNYRVEFSNQSVSPNPNSTIYKWTFGDGTTSNQFSPQHIYQAPGNYTVCLYMYDQQANCRDTICKQVLVGISTVPHCDASFSYTVSGSHVQFTSTSVPALNTTSHYWTFGDGTTSTQVNPLHIFANPGTYTVCLTIINSLNGCTDDVCHTVVIGSNQQQFCLTGKICKGIGSNPAFPAIVYLIYYDSTQGTLTAVGTTATTQNGEYRFCNVPHGRYLVKAALTPNSPDYHSFLPTYYGNSLFWNYAIPVILNQNRHGVDICLIAGNNPGGPGFVGGYVQHGANKMGSFVGDAVVGVQVMLLDLDDNPVQYTFSDDDGRFAFDDVAYGTYKVYAEVLDKATIPYIVTIGPENLEKDNIVLLVESTQVVSGLDEKFNTTIRSLRIYPNPLSDVAFVELNLTGNSEVKITVTDITGKMIVEEMLNGVSGEQIHRINISAQQAGIYLVRIAQGDVNKTIKLMKY
jgi:PKD repeat protein